MDERQIPRIVADGEVICDIDGVAHRLSLHNVSNQGCMTDSPAGLLLKGRRVVVEFLSDVAVPARVIWQHAQFMGLQFITSVPPAVTDRLAFKVRDAGPGRGLVFDRFGASPESRPDSPQPDGNPLACQAANPPGQ